MEDVLELDSTFAEVQARSTNTQSPLVPAEETGAGPITSISGGNSGFGFSGAPSSSMSSPLTTKGDIYVRTAAAGSRLPVGANDAYLAADSAQTTGLIWIAASTGWAAWTGTAVRTSKATYPATTASVAYVQAELQGVMDKLKEVSEALKAIIDDQLTQKRFKA